MRFDIIKITLTLLTMTALAYGNEDTKARMMWERLVGSYADGDATKVNQMAALIKAGKSSEAAQVATAEKRFIDYTVGRLVATWSNREKNPNTTYNSAMALAQGIIRDNKDFRQYLTGNMLYVADPALRGRARTGTGVGTLGTATTSAPPATSRANEFNWQFIEDNGFSPSDALQLQAGNQWTNVGNFTDFSGVYTLGTSKFLYAAGTNRRPVEWTFQTFMCKSDLHEVMDTQNGDRWVGRDVDRSDFAKYSTQCIGCHGAVLDPLRPAFAFLDAPSGTLNFLTAVAPKYSNNSGIFPEGFVVSNNTWENRANRGPNEALGWRSSMSGNGVNAFASMVANSQQFSTCMVSHVFKQMCLREATADEKSKLLKKIGEEFEGASYNMRKVYELTSSLNVCTGE